MGVLVSGTLLKRYPIDFVCTREAAVMKGCFGYGARGGGERTPLVIDSQREHPRASSSHAGAVDSGRMHKFCAGCSAISQIRAG